MPHQDASRWDARYLGDARFASYTKARSFLVENASLLPSSGRALDIAMGLGGNAAFLLERGLDVIGVDISWVAMRQAKNRLPRLQAVLADLNHFHLPQGAFDLILNFYYLQRDLWPQFQPALRPGGMVVIETMTREMLVINPGIEPEYLLAPGELQRAFSSWDILVYREGWVEQNSGHPRAVASLIARRP